MITAIPTMVAVVTLMADEAFASEARGYESVRSNPLAEVAPTEAGLGNEATPTEAGLVNEAAPTGVGTVNEKSAANTGLIDEAMPTILGGVLEFPIYSFYVGSPNINGKAFVPNFAPRLGPRVAWKKLGVRATFALPIPSAEIERRGESKQRNFIFNFYWKKYALDLYYQRFRGFYIASPFTELEVDRPSRYPQLPDAEVRHFGFNFYYKTHPTEFNFDNAFDQTQREAKAGRSTIIVPFYRHWKMDLGNRFIEGSDGTTTTMPNLAAGTFDTVGCTFGRTRTWVKDSVFLSLLWGLGPGLQIQKYLDSGNEFSKIAVAGKLNLNGSVGMRHKDYAYGAQAMLDTLYSRISGTEIYSTLASVEFFFNKRL